MTIEHKVINNVEYKLCCRCNEWLPLTEFGKKASASDGLYHMCKKDTRGPYKKSARLKRIEHIFKEKEELKKCSTCKTFLPLPDFNKTKTNWDGLSSSCKLCNTLNLKKYFKENKERILQYAKRPDVKERNKTRLKKARKESPEVFRRHRQTRRQLASNVLHDAFSERMRISLKGEKRYCSCFSLVPYSLKEYKNHLQSLWEPWMTWESYGNRPGCWVVDHIKPVVSFTFNTYTDKGFQECWALSNLRPLSYEKNCIKNSFYNGVLVRKP